MGLAEDHPDDALWGTLDDYRRRLEQLERAPFPILPGVMAPWAGPLSSLTGVQEPVVGWLLCNGAAVSRTTYAALFAVIGTAYGSGDGSTTFNLPDLRGRVVFGQASSGTFATRGATGGAETHNHTIAHTHSLSAHTHTLAHTHDLSNHTHSLGSHTHDLSNHTHSGSTLTTSTQPNASNLHDAGSTYGRTASHSHTISGSTGGPSTNTSGAASGSTGTPSTNTTGAASATNTGAPSADVTGSPSASNTGDASGLNPFQVVGGWLIKY